MDFNNIYDYEIEINKVSAYIKMYEMYEKPTRFTPLKVLWHISNIKVNITDARYTIH